MKNRLSLLFLLCFFFNISAQNNYKFTRYNNKKGLCNNEIRTIFQDHFGFIWFGTNDGCARFDGIKFRNFQYNENDSSTIERGWVTQIVEDSQGNLWFGIAGKKSLMKYIYEQDKFVDYTQVIKNICDENVKLHAVWILFIDSEDNLWIRSVCSPFLKYDMKNNIAKPYRYTTGESNNPLSFYDAIEDNDKIYFATNGGIYSYDKLNDTLNLFFFDSTNVSGINRNNCQCIYKDAQDILWVGTMGGLVKLRLKNSEITETDFFNYDKNNPASLSQDNIYDILEDKNGNLLIATIKGLNVYNRSKNTFKHYFNDEIDDESIIADLIRKLYLDKQNNIWVGTNAGISKMQNKNFLSYSHSGYKNSISHNKVQHIYQDKNSNIWLSTPVGIDKFNINSGVFTKSIDIGSNKNGLLGSPLVTATDNKTGFWIGTWFGGFSHYDYSANILTNYKEISDFKFIQNVFSILNDSKDNLLVNYNGLLIVNRKTGETKQFNYDTSNPNAIQSERIQHIIEDTDGTYWAATMNGLCHISIGKETKIVNYLDSLRIVYLHNSNDKNIWVASSHGLYKMDTKENKITSYADSIDVLKESIMSITQDDKNNFWAATARGIIRFRIVDNKVCDVISFHDEEGITIGECLPCSIEKLNDGQIMFGGTEGFCMFDPLKIDRDSIPPDIVFTNLKVRGEIVNVGQNIDGQIILAKSINYTKKISINFANNDFSIGFAGLQYNMAQYNQYQYFLEGHDKPNSEWHEADVSLREARYMNLPAGSYTFKARAANSYGVWNETPIELFIEILPPWWQTWLFRISVSICIIVLTLSFYFYRINALKKQKSLLEKKVFERTLELREANSQLEKKQEEILQQNEEIITVNNTLKLKNEEILFVNNQLKTKNDEIETQKEEIEASHYQLEKAFKNIQVLSEFGQKLTATFDFDAINKMIYDYVSSLMDTAAFGIGIYNEKRKIIDFPFFMENGTPVPYFFKELTNTKSLTVNCFKNSDEIVINDLSVEYKNYLIELPEVQTSNLPSSVIHLPLIIENRPIGTITVNSFKKDAYNENDVANLRTLASYISIALDNSKAYRIIRSKNEQISGSIRYGQTIQQAMLPPKEQIDTYFENFILFRPKDIVSGDFYWFASVNNPLNPQGLDSDNTQNPEGFEMGYYFLAVVDCTGHGVPGAFMSMIGSRLLNDIVIERKIYSPAKILDLLNTMIRKALRQDNTDNHDGMDVCLCRFMYNSSGMELTYAGAKRPLLYFNPETQKIDEINGTRRSIGGVASRIVSVEFKEQTIQVSNNNIFYLSTDGIIDQCNPQKRKFSQKKLIELLQQIHQKPIHEQKIIIENELDSFQKGFEQRDDITLMGLRVK